MLENKHFLTIRKYASALYIGLTHFQWPNEKTGENKAYMSAKTHTGSFLAAKWWLQVILAPNDSLYALNTSLR